MTLYYKAPTKYYKYVYSPYTLPKMTSQTAPEGKVGTNFVFGTHSKDLYSLFWNTTGWYIDISANTSANRYINYQFKNPLPPGTYTLSCKMKTQNNVTSTGYHWDIICDNGSGGNEYIAIGNPGTPPKTNTTEEWPSGSSYSWTFTSTKRIRAIELKINSPSVSSDSYICLLINNLNLTCEGGLEIQTGTVESTPADYDYSSPNLFKIRDYDTTGVYYSVGKSNCVLQLPKDINISLSNGIVTLKKGSKVYFPNGFESDGVTKKFDVYVVPEDKTLGTLGTVTNNGDILYLDWNKNLQPYGSAYVYSGTTTPTTTYAYWYDENNNIIKYTSNGGTAWYSGHSLPIALINRNNGTVTAITQVFNGFGYIGSTFFTVPGIEMLIPDGFNPDKTYKSIKVVTDKVVTQSYTATYSNINMYINNDEILVSSSPSYNANLNYVVDNNGNYISMAQVAKASGSSGKISALTLNTVNPPNTAWSIGFIHQNGNLLYKGRHYEAWSVPSGALSKGYSATGEASGSIGKLFDKNHDTRWGQGVEGNRKWFRLTLPYPVIVDAITVIQGFAGSHDDSRIYNVTFYAELTGANSTGGQIQISNKKSLNWNVASSTAITITNKPICKRIYCWTEGQAYSTLGEVYISGRRVL